MANIKCESSVYKLKKTFFFQSQKFYLDRLRRRNNFVKQLDIIDITKDEDVASKPKYIEIINLTEDYLTDASVSTERLAEFRERLHFAFRKKRLMSLLRLSRRVNYKNSDKFSKMEIQSALTQMADSNEIMISNGLVYLIINPELKLIC